MRTSILYAGLAVLAACSQGKQEASERAAFDAAISSPQVDAGRFDGGSIVRPDAGAPTRPPSPPCTPKACEPAACGVRDDGCQGQIQCECPLPFSCGASGLTGMCGLEVTTLRPVTERGSDALDADESSIGLTLSFSRDDRWLAVGGATTDAQGRAALGRLAVLNGLDLSTASEIVEAQSPVGTLAWGNESDIYHGSRGTPLIFARRFQDGMLTLRWSDMNCIGDPISNVALRSIAFNHAMKRVSALGDSGQQAQFCAFSPEGETESDVFLRNFSATYQLSHSTKLGRLVLAMDDSVRVVTANLGLIAAADTRLYGPGYPRPNRVAWLGDDRVVVALNTSVAIGTLPRSGTTLDLRQLVDTGDQVVSVRAHEATQTVATAQGDGTLRLYDANTGMERARAQAHSGPTVDLAYSWDGRFIATAGQEPTVNLFALE